MIQFVLIGAFLISQTLQQNSTCLSRQEAGQVGMAIISQLVDHLAQRCENSLPANAFLRTQADDFTSRLQAEMPASEIIVGIVAKISGQKLPPVEDGGALMNVIGDFVVSGLLADFPNTSCVDANALIEAIAPLPADNIANLTVSIISLSQSNQKPDDSADMTSESSVTICPA